MGDMEEKELKTSAKQRIIIGAIAVIMVGTFIASYAAIIIGGSNSASGASSGISDEKKAEYEAVYQEKLSEFKSLTQSDFSKLASYKGEVKAFNETSANENGVQTKDLVVGDGRELSEGDTNYLAYYIGWCADETIFDSTFDNAKDPTSFKGALDASMGLIEGWNAGVVGMKLGGVRRITVPGELAYGNNMEICGGYNKPLRFLILAVAKEDPLKTAAAALESAYMKYQYAQYGIDYGD